jgi:hypothetical protein
VTITTSMKGEGVDLTHVATDETFAYHRFDAFAIRPNTLEGTASQLEIKRFKVELISTASAFRFVEIVRTDVSSITYRWESEIGRTYRIESRDSLTTGDWEFKASVVANGPVTGYGETGILTNRTRFFRALTN